MNIEKISKDRILGFIKNNKIKTFFGVIGVLVLLWLLFVVVLVNGMGDFRSNSVDYMEKIDDKGVISMKQNFDSRMAGASSKSLSRVSVDIMPYPVEPQGEGEYDKKTDRKIIKNGNLSVIVKDIENSKSEIAKIVKENAGFVQNSNFSENDQYQYFNNERRKTSTSKNGSFTLKVPSKNFEKTFADLKKIALKINSESISGNDVTEQFADLKTQLKNKKAEVEQYRKILNKAEKIKDILEITRYLNTAQTQFESLQGRMNRLSNQVEMSTIYLNIVSESDVEVFGVTWSPLSELKSGFSNMIGDLKGFADDVIAFVFKLPIYILYIGGIVLAGRIVWKLFLKLKKKVWEKKKNNED